MNRRLLFVHLGLTYQSGNGGGLDAACPAFGVSPRPEPGFEMDSEMDCGPGVFHRDGGVRQVPASHHGRLRFDGGFVGCSGAGQESPGAADRYGSFGPCAGERDRCHPIHTDIADHQLQRGQGTGPIGWAPEAACTGKASSRWLPLTTTIYSTWLSSEAWDGPAFWYCRSRFIRVEKRGLTAIRPRFIVPIWPSGGSWCPQVNTTSRCASVPAFS